MAIRNVSHSDECCCVHARCTLRCAIHTHGHVILVGHWKANSILDENSLDCKQSNETSWLQIREGIGERVDSVRKNLLHEFSQSNLNSKQQQSGLRCSEWRFVILITLVNLVFRLPFLFFLFNLFEMQYGLIRI